MPGTGSPLPGQVLRVSIREEIYTRFDHPLLLRGLLCVSAQKGSLFDREWATVKLRESAPDGLLSLEPDARVGKTRHEGCNEVKEPERLSAGALARSPMQLPLI